MERTREHGVARPAHFDAAETLSRICRHVVALVPGADHASVTVGKDMIAGTIIGTAGTAGPNGAAGTVSVPLADGAALNLYGGVRDADLSLLELHISVATALVRATEVIDQLEYAIETRAVIEQAKGILMATHRTTEAEAFRMLVDRSQAENRKLHLVAAEFVASASAA